MLQADKRETDTKLKVGDIGVVLISAWLISQSLIWSNIPWFLIGYCFFLNYAIWRRDNG